jgi:phosphatidylserine/phosphatidylglycerophosphate/cardiolipin synthase-like enzyme
MIWEVGKSWTLLSDILIEAAQRGCDVQVHVDWVASRYVHGDLDLLPVLDRDKRAYREFVQGQNDKMHQRLVEGGVKVTITNEPFLLARILPVIKRNHIKLFLVDEIGWMGGLNLYDKALNNYDLMVKFDNPVIVGALASQYLQVNELSPKDDYIVDIGDSYRLVVDSGRHGVSQIYAEARTMIENATKSIFFLSQMVPEGEILDWLIRRAKEGISVLIMTSHSSEKTFTHYPHKPSYDRFRARIDSVPFITFLHLGKKVHAKLLIVDRREVLFGSHNMVDAGVLMGTQEIAMRTSDVRLVPQFVEYAGELR